MAVQHIPPELYQRYQYPVPRYTSYPPAPVFDQHWDESCWLEALSEAEHNEPDARWSLYVHLPFCDTLCYFCGCNMIITHHAGRVQRYLDHLHQEIALWRGRLPDGHLVDQMHWGGGTPTHLTPSQLKMLADTIRQYFDFTPEAEISCEIDPRGLTPAHLEALKAAGFNRISMGVQDLHPRVQQAVNRIQPLALTEEVIGWIRDLGFQSLNIDLMYGLPYQTAASFRDTIQEIIRLKPNRIAVFHYAHLPHIKKHQALIDVRTIPQPAEKMRMWLQTIDMLTAAGYVFIGLDHFALPDDELAIALARRELYRNFQGYSTRAGTHLFGLGITGISQLPGAYAQNQRTEQAYFQAVTSNRIPTARGYRLTEDDKRRRDVIMQIMCHHEVDKTAWNETFHLNFDEYFQSAENDLQQLQADGFIKVDDKKIRVTPVGMLFLRQIAYTFDAYRPSAEKPVYSASL